MEILGFINAFDELADTERRLGRKVANFGLVAALLEHGSADELHFFLPFQSAAGPFQEGYAPWLGSERNRQRVKLLPAVRLPEAVRHLDYLAIHAAELDRYFPELCHLRNQAAAQPFPVTCTTHTLNYWATQVRNVYKVLPGPRPFDAIFCTSRAARRHLEQAFAAASQGLAGLGLAGAGYGGRLEVVPLGIDTAQFGQVGREQALHNLGLEPGPVTILYMGRLTASDKCDLVPLLGMLAILNREQPVRLLLAGAESGGYGKIIMQTAATVGVQQQVHLRPNFLSEQKADIYAAGDIFLSPSDNLQETFGLTILEAMASGLPVVASDFSGYRDLVEHGRTGFLIPTLGPSHYRLMDEAWPLAAERVAALQVSQRTAVDFSAMTAYLGRLVKNPELRAELGRAGRRRVRERFDWSVVVRLMEEHWRRLKDEARAQAQAPPPPNPLAASLGRVFGHFFTRAIAPGDRLAPGPLAPVFRQGAWANNPYADLAGLLPPPALELMLTTLEQGGGELSLAQLGRILESKIPPEMLEHLALYGLKYGVLRLAGAEGGP